MKKTFILLLCLLMLMSMAGCQELDAIKEIELPQPPSAETARQSQESPEPTAPAEEVSPAEPEESAAPAEAAEKPQGEVQSRKVENPIMIKSQNTLLQEMDPAEGTQVILTFSYDTPKVYIEGRDQATAKINEYLGLVDEAYYTGSDYGVGQGSIGAGYDMMLTGALDNFSYYYNSGDSGEAMGLEHSSIRSFNTARADSSILSLVYHSSVYLGGAHGMYADHGFVFDSESGERLSLDMLSTDFDAFTAFLVEEMVSMAESDEYYSQRISLVEPEGYSEAFSAMLLREDSWYFDNDGMVIASNIDELGPYAAGIVEFHIPYEKLQGRLLDRYLPQPRLTGASFSVSAMKDVKEGSYQMIDKLTVDEGGSELCLISSGNAYDVSIVTVSYSDRFFEMEELWYCSEMGGSALQIITNIPDGIPNLMLKYRDGSGEEQRFLISMSGEDGSFILISDDIEVKG